MLTRTSKLHMVITCAHRLLLNVSIRGHLIFFFMSCLELCCLLCRRSRIFVARPPPPHPTPQRVSEMRCCVCSYDRPQPRRPEDTVVQMNAPIKHHREISRHSDCQDFAQTDACVSLHHEHNVQLHRVAFSAGHTCWKLKPMKCREHISGYERLRQRLFEIKTTIARAHLTNFHFQNRGDEIVRLKCRRQLLRSERSRRMENTHTSDGERRRTGTEKSAGVPDNLLPVASSGSSER